MADNTELDAMSGGDVYRSLEDASDVKWQAVVLAYPTTVGTPDVLTIPTAAALADNTANPTLIGIQVFPMVWDGTTWDRLPGTSADGVTVNLGSNNDVTITGTVTVGSHAVTNAGVFAVQVDNTVTVTGMVGVSGVVEITNDSGNPIPVNGTVNAAQSGTWNVATVTAVTTVSTVTAVTSITNPVTVAQATAGNLNCTEASAAAIRTAVEAMDDWDESDRAKVNLVVGQAGVSAGDGTVAANTPRMTLATDQETLTNLIGRIVNSADVASRYSGLTEVTPKFVNIDTASSGNNELVAAVSGKTLVVLSLCLVASGAVDVYFNDGTANLFGGTRKIKLDNTGAVGPAGFVLQENRTGWFKTAATNRPINMNLSGATGVAGVLCYVEV